MNHFVELAVIVGVVLLVGSWGGRREGMAYKIDDDVCKQLNCDDLKSKRSGRARQACRILKCKMAAPGGEGENPKIKKRLNKIIPRLWRRKPKRNDNSGDGDDAATPVKSPE